MRSPRLVAALGFSLTAAFCQSGSDPIQKYSQQIQANPANSRAHYELAEIYLGSGDYTRAANEYRAALNGDLEPKLIEVLSHLGLAKVFERSGQADRAANERQQATRASEEKPQMAIDTTAAPPPAPLRISPVPIEQTEPEYSDEARAAGLEGTVYVDVHVAPDGTPRDPKIESSLGLGLDEKAIECVRRWRFAPPPIATLDPVRVAVNFLLPAKLSRWHLVSASFDVPGGAARPIFKVIPYPLGAGVSDRAIDEGWVISAIPRAADIRLRFEVNERGVPLKFEVVQASADLWGNEAIAVVRRWRFTPGTKDGKPVAVPCTVDLIWGQKLWTPEILAKVRGQLRAAAPEPAPSLVQAVAATAANPVVTAAYLIDDPQRPHNQVCVVLSVFVGENGALDNTRVIRSLGYTYDAAAIDAMRGWKPISEKSQFGPRYIEVDFAPR